MKSKASALFRNLQTSICDALEAADGQAKFETDTWTREDVSGAEGGGGITRIIRRGKVFEQGGVNFSEVHGMLPASMTQKLIGKDEPSPFFATGVSLVLHPHSPQVPTVHANFRFLELGSHAWFGGGADLTPFVFYADDAEHFHTVLKTSCDRHNSEYYPRFKKHCDEYFFIPHRGETRGIGGVFFDYLGKEDRTQLPEMFPFVSDIGNDFVAAYVPIVLKRRELDFTEQQKQFQLLRRGRYVEFNLVYDRGTQFGLHTNGRTESILMSMPPLARWEYCASFPENSPEAELLEILKNPREWVS